MERVRRHIGDGGHRVSKESKQEMGEGGHRCGESKQG